MTLVVYVTLVVCSTLVRRYDSTCTSRLRSHFSTPVDVATSVISPDSDRASRLQLMSVPHVLPPQLWKTSHGWAKWLQHFTTWTLSQKQTRRDTWLVQRSKPQHLTTSHVQVLGHVPCDQWQLDRFDLRETRVFRRTRYPCNSGRSRSLNVG
jgi:hypothetical protein